MPAANTKANYKTYEAQARMVRAIVAAHPEVKWNYKGKTWLDSLLSGAPTSYPLVLPTYFPPGHPHC